LTSAFSDLVITSSVATSSITAIFRRMGAKIEIPQGSPFTIHNIPFGVISTTDNPTPRCATAIGNHAIDLALFSQNGYFDDLDLQPSPKDVFSEVHRSRSFKSIIAHVVSHRSNQLTTVLIEHFRRPPTPLPILNP
jgi:hypothetical protein